MLLVFYAPWFGTRTGALLSIVVSLVATIAWFLMGNPYDIDPAYVALVIPLIIMGLSSLMMRIRGGKATFGLPTLRQFAHIDQARFGQRLLVVHMALGDRIPVDGFHRIGRRGRALPTAV